MNNKKTILSMTCLLTTLLTNASQPPLNQKSFLQKTMDTIGQSQLMCWFEKNISTRLSSCWPNDLEGRQASQHYQKLGKEAQSAVGIPEEYHVPVRRMSHMSDYALTANAVILPKAIYMNEDCLNKQPYGMQRFVAFHEAVHKKYNDNSMKYAPIFLSGCATLSYIMYKLSLLEPIKPRTILIIVTILITTLKICSDHTGYVEQRADIEGGYATQCSTCVHEKYCSYLDYIEQDLKKQNKLCAYHKNNA